MAIINDIAIVMTASIATYKAEADATAFIIVHLYQI